MIETALILAVIVGLTILSGLFSGSEAALFSLSITQIKSLKADTHPRRRLIADLLAQPRDLLVTVFMLNTLVNILLQNVISDSIGEAGNLWVKVGIPLALTLFFGEIIPKYLGIQNNSDYAYRIAPVIHLFQSWLRPIRQAVIAITGPISRVMFFYLKKEESISKDELQHVLKTSEEHGLYDANEEELIIGYLDLQDTVVKEIMRPREDILYYDVQDPLSKLTYLFVDQECTRVPVCDKTLDTVLGIIDAKQFFLNRDNLKEPSDLIPILSKPFYVPESTWAQLLLRQFDNKREVFALVVDEYGSISGLITKEDLIEIVIGEVEDLRDKKELFTRSGQNEIIASGKLELDTFNDLFGVDFESPTNMVTIGGWLIEHLGEIPKGGSKHEINNFLFQVLSATPSRIRRLYIRKLR
jgi:CBS domain containing-hemolysin-like protein